MTITCLDERPGTNVRVAACLAVSSPVISARALIRARVEIEVERLLAQHEELREEEAAKEARLRAQLGDWLVRPDAVETLLNGDRGPYGPGTSGLVVARSDGGWTPDVERMVETALEGFQRGDFFLFAGECQVIDLDQMIDVPGTAEVTFLRLIPLVGG